MDPTRPSPHEAGAPDSAPGAGLGASFTALWTDLSGSAHDHLQIIALEGQRAALSLVWIAVYATVVGMLVAATWLAAAGALVLWLIDSGLGASAALLLGAAINLLGVFGFLFLIRKKSHALAFPATLRSLERDATTSTPESVQTVTKP